jgi:hypothetical protein
LSKTLEEAKDQHIKQEDVINHIMTTNPPDQIIKGEMTVDEWVNKYMSKEPDGYAFIKVSPSTMNLPMKAGMADKVEKFTGLKTKAPPIVVDSNDVIQARIGGGKLDQAYGMLDHVVIDGKHRLEAAINRGDETIEAFIPRRKLSEIWNKSHSIELNQYAESYFEKKGYPIIRRISRVYTVRRNGENQDYTITDIERIAAKLGKVWTWK